MKNQRCQPPASARKLNAAPVVVQAREVEIRQHRQDLVQLETRRRRTTWSAGRARRRAPTSHSQQQRRLSREQNRLRSCETPRLARAVEIRRRSGRRSPGASASWPTSGALVPAAHALRRRIDGDRDPGAFLRDAISAATAVGRPLRRGCTRACEVMSRKRSSSPSGCQCARCCAASQIDVDLGVERRADARRRRAASPARARRRSRSAITRPSRPRPTAATCGQLRTRC